MIKGTSRRGFRRIVTQQMKVDYVERALGSLFFSL